VPDAKNLLFDAQSLMNSIARELNLSMEVVNSCNSFIHRYYSELREYYSNPPVVVASILYLVTKQLGEQISVSTITTACGVSVRWFEKRRGQLLKDLTGI